MAFVKDWEGKYYNLEQSKWLMVREGRYKGDVIGYGIFISNPNAQDFMGIASDKMTALGTIANWAKGEALNANLMSLTQFMDGILADKGPQERGTLEKGGKRLLWLEREIQREFIWGDIVGDK